MTRTLVIATLIVAAGCSSSSPLRRTYENTRAAYDAACDCYEVLGFDSREACEATQLDISDAQLDCLDREYQMNAAAADPAVVCQADASDALLACLRAVSDCDPAMFGACTSEFSTASGACPMLPTSVQLRFQTCQFAGDRDGDGVPDSTDVCPDEPEDGDGFEDTDGCPESAEPEYTYSACVDTSDCSDLDDQCILLSIPSAGTDGSFCSHACAADVDCEANLGFPGACHDIEGAGLLCYQTCVDALDCYPSSVCVELAHDGGFIDFVCVPDN